MDIEKALRFIFPEAPAHILYSAENPWIIHDDGAGPYIAKWNYAQEQPTQTALEAATQEVTKAELCRQIDDAADAARRAVAGDPLRAVEYERAAAEARAFADAGYPAESVPRTVAAWAIGGRSAQQAADSILAESAAYTEALYQIREARLQAKELVRQAMTAGDSALAEDIAAETIASIEAAVAGIGNNA